MSAAETTSELRSGGLAAAGKRFVGRATSKIDCKGRVSIPAEMRRHLEGVTLSDKPPVMMRAALSFIGQELWCGGPDLADVLMDIARDVNIFDVETNYELQAAVFAEIENLHFDDTGRVVLPKQLREEAGLTGAVAFVGQGAYFVLGDAERMNKKRTLRRRLIADNQEGFMARSAASRVSREGGPTS